MEEVVSSDFFSALTLLADFLDTLDLAEEFLDSACFLLVEAVDLTLWGRWRSVGAVSTSWAISCWLDALDTELSELREDGLDAAEAALVSGALAASLEPLLSLDWDLSLSALTETRSDLEADLDRGCWQKKMCSELFDLNFNLSWKEYFCLWVYFVVNIWQHSNGPLLIGLKEL